MSYRTLKIARGKKHSFFGSIDTVILKKRLEPYLNSLQIHALLSRIKKLNKAIIKTAQLNAGFLLKDSDWNVETVSREIGLEYGNTYLTKALKINKEKTKANVVKSTGFAFLFLKILPR